MSILGSISLACNTIALASILTGRLKPTTWYALLATAAAFNTLDAINTNAPVWAAADAALTAYWIHRWWNNGGGDGTRRRLRDLRRRFEGVRRTAPQGAA